MIAVVSLTIVVACLGINLLMSLINHSRDRERLKQACASFDELKKSFDSLNSDFHKLHANFYEVLGMLEKERSDYAKFVETVKQGATP